MIDSADNGNPPDAPRPGGFIARWTQLIHERALTVFIALACLGVASLWAASMLTINTNPDADTCNVLGAGALTGTLVPQGAALRLLRLVPGLGHNASESQQPLLDERVARWLVLRTTSVDFAQLGGGCKT